MAAPPRPPEREIDPNRIKYYGFFLPIAIVAASFISPTARRGCGHRDEDDAGGLRPLPE
jgi:hypothetical protein